MLDKGTGHNSFATYLDMMKDHAYALDIELESCVLNDEYCKDIEDGNHVPTFARVLVTFIALALKTDTSVLDIVQTAEKMAYQHQMHGTQ
jgi:hypothetical protein